MNRDSILAALTSKLGASAAFATISRRMQLWSTVGSADKPALFVRDRADLYQRSSEATQELVTMQVEIYLYTDADSDGHSIPSTTLNSLLDAVDAALKPDALTGKQTLGGLVSHCWIEGKIIKDAGDISGNGLAIIPVRILVPR